MISGSNLYVILKAPITTTAENSFEYFFIVFSFQRLKLLSKDNSKKNKLSSAATLLDFI